MRSSRLLGVIVLLAAGAGVVQALRASGPFEPLSAPGRLELAGETRKLAAPLSGNGMSPRLVQLLVREGESVQRGQVLARFDTGPALQAERQLLQRRSEQLRQQASRVQADVERFRPLVREGALSRADLQQREQQLVELQAGMESTRQAIARTDAELENSALRAPMDGKVLRLYARVGERPGVMNVLELGTSDRLEAIAEVDATDLTRIRLGQPARISSLSGAFPGSLAARVRQVNPADGAPSDGVVDVQLELDPADARRVRQLVGLRTITRFAS